MIGFKGEEVLDDKIWIAKTHFPNRYPWDVEYYTNRSICCVRNPLDIFSSQFSFFYTWSQNLVIKNDFHIEFKDAWETLVK